MNEIDIRKRELENAQYKEIKHSSSKNHMGQRRSLKKNIFKYFVANNYDNLNYRSILGPVKAVLSGGYKVLNAPYIIKA